jgi:membrane associated rhomboid family serine protease
MTVHANEQGLGSLSRGEGSDVKRSQGMFHHPGIPAGLSGLVLPLVLAYFITAKTNRDRVLVFLIYALGFLSLLLTFSRAGASGNSPTTDAPIPRVVRNRDAIAIWR